MLQVGDDDLAQRDLGKAHLRADDRLRSKGPAKTSRRRSSSAALIAIRLVAVAVGLMTARAHGIANVW
jgi:hypothetical protein